MACALSSKASISGRVAGCRAPVAARARVLAPVRRHQLLARAEAGTVVAAEVTDASFEEDVLNSPVPVLVDFWAPWCGPCRMIAPIVDELAGEYSGKLKCVKLNTDESPGVATKYGIRSIPTVMIFKNGNKMDTVIGAVPKSTLIQTIDKYL